LSADASAVSGLGTGGFYATYDPYVYLGPPPGHNLLFGCDMGGSMSLPANSDPLQVLNNNDNTEYYTWIWNGGEG